MRYLLAVSCAALVSAVGAHATRTSGLYGIVMRGPITPVCVVGQPCSEPAVGAVLSFARSGHTVARVKTKAGGRYKLVLAPGLYAVRTYRHRIEPATATVRAGRMTRLDFSIDTGIR